MADTMSKDPGQEAFEWEMGDTARLFHLCQRLQYSVEDGRSRGAFNFVCNKSPDMRPL